MPVITMAEAEIIKRNIREAVLNTVVNELQDGLERRVQSVPASMTQEIMSRLRSLKDLIDRSSSDSHFHLQINETGIHIWDREGEFHM